jgi:steroid delta-isomerase-like uncharacterized protein
MSNDASSEAKAVVRRNTEEVQGKGNFDVFEELFADDFVDHTPQPGMTPDKPGARRLYKALRTAFPDFHAVIHWQTADGEVVTTFKTYQGTHQGTFLGVAPTGRKIHFEAVDAMRVHERKITEHWGAANLFSLMQQLGALPSAAQARAAALSRRRRGAAWRLPDLPRCDQAGFRARNGDEFCQPED